MTLHFARAMTPHFARAMTPHFAPRNGAAFLGQDRRLAPLPPALELDIAMRHIAG
jgi:hypothetical protein